MKTLKANNLWILRVEILNNISHFIVPNAKLNANTPRTLKIKELLDYIYCSYPYLYKSIIQKIENKRRIDGCIRQKKYKKRFFKIKRNIERYNQHRKEYYHLVGKYKPKTTNQKLINTMRNRLCNFLKRGYNSKTLPNIIGCSIEQLKQHLEKQFKIGMTWNNYGKYGWHVDHIIPCSNFDLIKIDEQKKCFNYLNLQPLWALENILKGNKILEISK